MDLTTKVPERNALFAGEPKALKLAFNMNPFVMPTGKYISVALPTEAKPPAFVLKDVKLAWGWSDKFRTISIPAPPGSAANTLAARLETLATKASSINAVPWFGKPSDVVEAAVTIKAGTRESQGTTYLTLKAPSQEEDPSFYDIDGKEIQSDADLRGCTADVLFVCNGLFIRGLDVFVQLKCVAIAKTGEATKGSAGDLHRKMAAFTLVE